MKTCFYYFSSFWLSLLILLSPFVSSHAATITWTNTIGGAWNSAENWRPNQVPASTDSVIITNSGTYKVDLDASPTVSDLLLGGASGTQTLVMNNQALNVTSLGTVKSSGQIALDGGSFNGALTIAGIMNWTNGQVMGALTVAGGGVLNLGGDATMKQLYGVLTNAGTVNYTGAGFQLVGNYGGGNIYNIAGGRFDLQTDQLINWNNGSEVINNAGLFLKSKGTNISVIYPIFNNTGTVEARSGGIQFQNGGLLGGTYTAADTTTINLGSGTFTLTPGVNFTGAGSERLIGGSLVCAGLGAALDLSHLELAGGNLLVDGAIANLTLKGAALYGTNATISGVLNFNSGVVYGTNRITGTLNWTEGQVMGALTVAGGGVLNLAGDATMKQLYGVLTNAGTVNYTGAGFQLVGNYGGGNIYNIAGGRFDLQTDQLINWNNGSEVINNAGLFLKSKGTNISVIYPIFNNTGTVEARSGGIQFQNGGLLGGTYTAADTTTINLGSGTFTMTPGVNFTGAGSERLIGGSLVCAGLGAALDLSHLELAGGNLLVDGAIANLTLKGAALYGTNATISGVLNFNSGVVYGTNRITGMLNWTEGLVNGALTVAGGGVLNLAGDATMKQLYGVLTNAGTVNYTGAGFQLVGNYGGGIIYNIAGGRFDLQTDQLINWNIGSEVINNAGLFLKSKGTNITLVNPIFNNTGTVEARSGGIQFQNGGLLGGTFTAADTTTINLGGGVFTLSPGFNFTGAGSNRLIGGSLVCAGLGAALDLSHVELAGGNLMVDGAITNLTLKGSALYGTNATISGVLNFNSGVVYGTNRIIGMLNWTEGQVMGSLTVVGGGVLNLAGDATMKQLYGVLTNAGTVNYTGAGFQLVGNYGGGIIYNIAGGRFDLQTDQLINWNIGSEVINNAGLFLKSKGTNITLVNPIFNNTGTVEARSGGIQFQSQYSDSSSASFIISLGGTVPGIGFIQFANPVSFHGKLIISTVNSFRPNPGDNFQILNFPSAGGHFSCLNGLDFGQGLRLDPVFSENSLTLAAVAYPTSNLPILRACQSMNSVFITWPIEFSGWKLYSTTNLALPFGTSVPVAGTNNTVVETTVPRMFFRLVK